ncbi:hypothetical protein LX36DRAFT_316291 [Colletotrichum falcatum]|nr:hypothetical protein LX36DRAFT_316291 [Colletotrichum falcatum]
MHPGDTHTHRQRERERDEQGQAPGMPGTTTGTWCASRPLGSQEVCNVRPRQRSSWSGRGGGDAMTAGSDMLHTHLHSTLTQAVSALPPPLEEGEKKKGHVARSVSPGARLLVGGQVLPSARGPWLRRVWGTLPLVSFSLAFSCRSSLSLSLWGDDNGVCHAANPLGGA